MPIFAYLCDNCGKTFEELIFSPAAEKSLKCPSCGATSFKRQMAPFAVGKASAGSQPGCSQGACSSCQYNN
jgi:putative FmdB family regulatory protein